jgi:RNA polymerase sigma-70 factor (ECF subfamily)
MVTDDMVALVPQLHTFARSLTRDGVRADDLVQEALMRAFNNIDRFRPGTNLKAWLFTIVRNEHYSQLRRRKFEAHGIDTDMLPEPSVPPDHDGKLELRDLNRALASLSPGQRTALILVSASGFSYEEAAAICGCAVGTIKSRVARARETLLQMLDGTLPIPEIETATDADNEAVPTMTTTTAPRLAPAPTRRPGLRPSLEMSVAAAS